MIVKEIFFLFQSYKNLQIFLSNKNKTRDISSSRSVLGYTNYQLISITYNFIEHVIYYYIILLYTKHPDIYNKLPFIRTIIYHTKLVDLFVV